MEGAPGSRTLQVSVAHNECGTGDPRVNVEEGDAVLLSAEFDQGRGSCDDIGLTTKVSVDLARALGDRTVEVRQVNDRSFRCDIGSDRCRRSAVTP